jgi:hypothetical protein
MGGPGDGRGLKKLMQARTGVTAPVGGVRDPGA